MSCIGASTDTEGNTMDHVEESTRLAQYAAELLGARENPNPVAVTQLALTHALLAVIQIELRENEEHKAAMATFDERRVNLTGVPSSTD